MFLICIDWEKVSFMCGGYILHILLPACLREAVSNTKRERIYFCKKCIIHTMILVDSCKEQ